MFFTSFSQATGRVVIFTAIGLGVLVAALKVYQWSPAVIAAFNQTLGA